MMKTIDIIPKIYQDVFMARLVMSDYNIGRPLSITVFARRSDGIYQTERIEYPSSAYEGTKDILIPFFAMTKTCVGQIIGVTVNNVDINTYFTTLDFDSEKFMFRYDDTLVSLDNNIDTSPLDLKFHVYSDGDPAKLIVVDESNWGGLKNYPSMIHIKMPGFEHVLDYYLSKNQVNIFNSITLGLGCDNGDNKPCITDLPDGIYDIEIGAGEYFYNRKYLKVDALRLDLDKIYSRSCLTCDVLSNELIESVTEAEILIRGAEAETRLGNFESAHMLIDRVVNIVDRASNCKNCK